MDKTYITIQDEKITAVITSNDPTLSGVIDISDHPDIKKIKANCNHFKYKKGKVSEKPESEWLVVEPLENLWFGKFAELEKRLEILEKKE